MTKGKHHFPCKTLFFFFLVTSSKYPPVSCTRVLMVGFEIVHQLNIPLQAEVECSGLDLHVVLSLVAVPRAAAGEEAAA